MNVEIIIEMRIKLMGLHDLTMESKRHNLNKQNNRTKMTTTYYVLMDTNGPFNQIVQNPRFRNIDSIFMCFNAKI